MFSSRFLLLFLVSIILTPSFCFGNTREKRASLGVLNGYQFYFKKYSNRYHFITWDGNIQTLQQALSLNNKIIDLLLLNKKTAEQACNLGLLIPLHDDLLSSNNKQCDFQTFTDHIALAWDTQKLHFNPTWKDFWNITQYPGKRGLQKDALSALSIALLADGVSSEDVIEVLSTPSGILRAFKKLNQLRPYIVWWTTPNEANFLLYKNQVLMTSASVLSINAFQQQHPLSHFQFQHQNTVESPIVLSIPVTIQTHRIKMINDLLKTHPLHPFSTSNPKHRIWHTSIPQESISPQQSSVSLDEIFDEWLHLTKQ
ncbi:extracellular solute-binding protein [Commensalibacter papalotli (ex Botero et al. 2024)]|uniref:Spermidine/putrescine-binding periplasmic protein (PotD) (PDB:1POT) n=1 Tax=Commensalibacter papalotli (ex Botero et al. 2024) TaxID=2972766 RepID=A0ABN8W9L6_9PROT|nr:extracellular solute-binding protein [Commensalibacter papalotli (ex Botero et al. 2024)]CAI3944009.1 Spermidine/putrescine-binding periplasmic protein (PotD) (PDB:1POT) [Commensalibacter papalotli (ex Botero et al. 2024)]CAI3946875.1 Spermidine/putrescine-binding periplasmic protein (PotD) (PDB:1POT) [Commensalibacter papalotli (ex Botero et al. 2024)]